MFAIAKGKGIPLLNPTQRARKKAKKRPLSRPKPKRRTPPRGSQTASFFHAIKRPGHYDIYHVTKGKPEFVTCLKSWELASWAKRKGIAIK